MALVPKTGTKGGSLVRPRITFYPKARPPWNLDRGDGASGAAGNLEQNPWAFLGPVTNAASVPNAVQENCDAMLQYIQKGSGASLMLEALCDLTSTLGLTEPAKTSESPCGTRPHDIEFAPLRDEATVG